MYAQRRSEVEIPVPPRNYSGNAFRYPPPTPLPPVREGLAEQEEVRREEAVADAETVALPSEGDGVARQTADEKAAPWWQGILQSLGSEELLLLGLLLLVADEGGRELPLCLLILLLGG